MLPGSWAWFTLAQDPGLNCHVPEWPREGGICQGTAACCSFLYLAFWVKEVRRVDSWGEAPTQELASALCPRFFFYAAPLFSSCNTGSFSDGCLGHLHAKRCFITHSIADTFGRENPISEKRGLAWYQEPVQGPSHMPCSFSHFSAPLPLWGIFLLSVVVWEAKEQV